jgi:hypothetical protein
VLLPPSPKVQAQPVISPVEVSVKLTVNGASPLVGLAEKAATGGGGVGSLTLMVAVAPSDPPGPVTVSSTV